MCGHRTLKGRISKKAGTAERKRVSFHRRLRVVAERNAYVVWESRIFELSDHGRPRDT